MEVSVLRVKNYIAQTSNEIPDDALEALARCLYPAIISYFASDEGQREFDEWKSRQGNENIPGGEAESDEQVRRVG